MGVTDQERNIIIIALSILAFVAFVAFLLILCDPLLFRHDDENDGDIEDKYMPKWSVSYPDQEAYEQRYREYQQEYQKYYEEYQRYQQQQAFRYSSVSAPEAPEIVPQGSYNQPKTQPPLVPAPPMSPPVMQQEEKEEIKLVVVSEKASFVQEPPPTTLNYQKQSSLHQPSLHSIPEILEASDSSPSTQSSRHDNVPATSSTTALVVYDAPNQLELYDTKQTRTPSSLVPFDESDGGSRASSFRSYPSREEQKTPLPTAKNELSPQQQQQIGQADESETNEGSIVEIQPYSPKDSVASLPEELKNFHIRQSSNNEDDQIPVSPITPARFGVNGERKDTSPPPEANPASYDDDYEGEFIPPTPPRLPRPAAATNNNINTTKVNNIKPVAARPPAPPPRPPPGARRLDSSDTAKNMIPRYSHKAERQRFIVLNALIIVILLCIATVLVIRFLT